MTAFNKYLKTLREQKFLDIGTVAERIGVHRNTQSKYEDSRDPPFDYLVEFAALVDVPLTHILLKRLENSKASDSAVFQAATSLEHMELREASKTDTNEQELLHVTLGEPSHEPLLICASVFVDTTDKSIDTNSMYCFLNPMNGKYFAAKLQLSGTQLKIVFNSSLREDLSFSIEGGETESHYILKTLGLLGRIKKAELTF